MSMRGDKPLKTGGIFATLVMAVAAALAVTGLVLFLTDTSTGEQRAARWSERADWVRIGRLATANPPEWERTEWAKTLRGQTDADREQVPPPPRNGLALEVGYKIDHLTALMFAMVTVISTAIFVFSLGFVLVLAVILIYIAANIGVVKYYWTQARSEFNWLLHFVFPVGTSLILIWSVYTAFNPFPAPPNNWSPLVVAIWLLLGIVILIWMKATGNESWLSKAAEIIVEHEETAAEKKAAHTL